MLLLLFFPRKLPANQNTPTGTGTLKDIFVSFEKEAIEGVRIFLIEEVKVKEVCRLKMSTSSGSGKKT